MDKYENNDFNENVPGKKYCQSCGGEMNKGDVFCPYCGAKQNNGQRCYAARPKERIIYIVLALFLGCFGIHNFYAGYTKTAVTQLLITILLGWIGLGILITFVWYIVDIITVTQDADGVPFN